MIKLLDIIGRPWAVPCDPPKSFDCFELCIEVRKRLGLPTPSPVSRNARKPHHRDFFKNVPDLWQKVINPRTGCVVIMNSGNHVGIYIPDRKVVHSQYSRGVRVDEVDMISGPKEYWELKEVMEAPL